MDIENTTYSGVGKHFEYQVLDDWPTFVHDIYGQIIYTNELFVYINHEDVHFDNICRYLDERYDDQYASELNDSELIEYVQDKYKAYVGVHN